MKGKRGVRKGLNGLIVGIPSFDVSLRLRLLCCVSALDAAMPLFYSLKMLVGNYLKFRVCNSSFSNHLRYFLSSY